MNRRDDVLIAVYLFVGVFLLSGLSRVNTSFDSRWTVYIAMSLWREQNTDLDEYKDRLQSEDYYAVECVSPEGIATRGINPNCRGHYYNSFPIGGPVLTAPLVWGMLGILKVARPLFSKIQPNNEVIRGFFGADFDLGHPLIEQEVASLLLAGTSVLIYFIARRFLTKARALLLAMIFAIATPAYSVAGRALWQHTPSMLLLAVIILMLLRAEEKPAVAGWIGIPVALAYTVRPTDALFVMVFTAYVAWKYRPFFVKYLLGATPIAAIFLAYNFSIYHAILSPYYRSPLDGFYPANFGRLGEALAGNLISPSRGLFIYTPVFLFSVWSMVVGLWRTAQAAWLGGLTFVHWVAVSSYIGCWWAGACYGPRFFTDLTPIFVLFLIPYLARWEGLPRAARAAFVSATLVGFAMHLRGGWSQAVYRWNDVPVSVNAEPQRNWDWSDPPFLRTR